MLSSARSPSQSPSRLLQSGSGPRCPREDRADRLLSDTERLRKRALRLVLRQERAHGVA